MSRLCVGLGRLVLHRRPLLTLSRSLYSSAAKDAGDDVTFGVLDEQFLDSRSLRMLKKSAGHRSKEFVPKSDVAGDARRRISPAELKVDREADEFGSAATKDEIDLEVDVGEEGVDDHFIRLSKFDRKHRPSWYDHRLIKLSKRGQVTEALRLLKEEMIGKDRVMPTKVSYTVVISAMAKAGYTDLAFKLFYEMRERGIKAPRHVFSALFNACANCADKQKGLRKAYYLRDYMERKNAPTHFIMYKAQMKAFAWTGDLSMAFKVLDEAVANGHTVDVEAWSMLLMACVSDKQSGFLHAVKVWRMMLQHSLRPEIHQYNLLARCVLECGAGDPQLTQQLLQTRDVPRIGGGDQLTGPGAAPGHARVGGSKAMKSDPGSEENRPNEDSSGDVETANVVSWDKAVGHDFEPDVDLMNCDTTQAQQDLVLSEDAPAIPDILSPIPRTSNVLGIASLAKAEDRLASLGGVPGILTRMHRDGVKPDIKTFSMVLDCLEEGEESEKSLLETMEKEAVEVDTPFCNLLMRRRVFRRDDESAKAVLELMGSHQLEPDLHTYATLALTCHTKQLAQQLLNDIEAQEVAVTSEIFSHLNQAAYLNFAYRQWLCHEMESLHIPPDDVFIRKCESLIREAEKLMRKWEMLNQNGERERNFRRRFRAFREFYEPWLKRTKLKQRPREPQRLDELTKEVRTEMFQVEEEDR